MAKSDRRPQAKKTIDRVARVQGLRSSGAAGIHSGQGEYRRPSKHAIWVEALDELEDSWDYGYSNEW